MTLKTQIRRFAVVAGAAALLGQVAEARVARVDFYDDSSPDNLALSTTNFLASGEAFRFPPPAYFLPGNGTIPFSLNFGTGPKSYDYCLNAGGFVSFAVSEPSGNPCNAADPLSGDYVAPLKANLSGVNVVSGFGLVDSVHSGSAADPFDLADATAAFRFIWQAPDPDPSVLAPILSELLILDKGGGNFNLLFGYGSVAFGTTGVPDIGQQIISLGTNKSGPTAGPFSSETNYSFNFSSGTCATCTGGGSDGGGGTVTVPEPSTLLLMSCALLMLPFLRRRRDALNFPAA